MHDFASKRNALFACLDDASSELKGTVLDQTESCAAPFRTGEGALAMNYRQASDTRNKRLTPKRTLQHLRGKESIFKKPELPIARCLKPRTLPDYQMNPHKWRKYSLDDVDISEQTNSSAALEFLREIEERKGAALLPENCGHEEKKIEFKKSSKIKRNMKSLQSREQLDAEIDSPKLKGSKLVMPEYVVGQKNTTAFKRKSFRLSDSNNEQTERAAGKLLLSHLQNDDDEE